MFYRTAISAEMEIRINFSERGVGSLIYFKWHEYFVVHFMVLKWTIKHSFNNCIMKTIIVIIVVVYKYRLHIWWTVSLVWICYIMNFHIHTFYMAFPLAVDTLQIMNEWLNFFLTNLTQVYCMRHNTSKVVEMKFWNQAYNNNMKQ